MYRRLASLVVVTLAAALLSAPAARADQTTVVTESSRQQDWTGTVTYLGLRIADAVADTVVTVTVGGHEVEVLGVGAEPSRLAVIRLFPTPEPSWVPGPGTYPIHVGGTSHGEPLSVDLAPIDLDPTVTMALDDAPATVVKGEGYDGVAHVRLQNMVHPSLFSADAPFTFTGAGETRDAVTELHFVANGPYGSATVTLRGTGLDGSERTVSFAVKVVPPPDDVGPFSVMSGDSTATFHHRIVTARWSVMDASAIARVEARTRSYAMAAAPGPWGPVQVLPGGARSAPLSSRRGQTTCLQVRAVDVRGNTGDWSSTRCLTRAADDRALAVRGEARRGRWHGHSVTVLRGENARLILPGRRTAAKLIIKARWIDREGGPLKVRLGDSGWISLLPPAHGHAPVTVSLVTGQTLPRGRLVIRDPYGERVAAIDAVLLR